MVVFKFYLLFLFTLISCNVFSQQINYEEDLHLQDSILKIIPGDCYAHFNRAAALRKLGRYKESLVDINIVITNCRDDGYSAYFSRAKAYEALQRYDEAIADYFKAAKDTFTKAEGLADCYFQIGLCLTKQEKYGKALKFYSDALALYPVEDKGICYYNRGLAYYHLNQLTMACADFYMAASDGVKGIDKIINDNCK